MHVINAVNVNDAYVLGQKLILDKGERQQSRNGPVVSLQEPLAVVYSRPTERVLLDQERDANPFFFLFESLWLLAGRDDARWLDRFVHDFSERFAEEGGRLHGSYGFRWRRHFDLDGEGNPNTPDQLNTVVRLLKANPWDRRVVIQMWDPVADLGQSFKDVPCNLIAVPRIRETPEERPIAQGYTQRVMDLTVFNRSNDFKWGMAGANAVQFSILLEYLAGRVGVAPGTYTQISTNAHLYDATTDSVAASTVFPYPSTVPMGENWGKWDEDLHQFMRVVDEFPYRAGKYHNSWFRLTAEPLLVAHHLWKNKAYSSAIGTLKHQSGVAPDWRMAAIQWMERRLARMASKKAGT